MLLGAALSVPAAAKDVARLAAPRKKHEMKKGDVKLNERISLEYQGDTCCYTCLPNASRDGGLVPPIGGVRNRLRPPNRKG